MSKKQETADSRLRNYATVVYPESAPQDWIEILSQQYIECFVSPLHDNDINANGEPKKPHYHVIIMYSGKKSVEQAKDLFSLIGGVGCEPVQSIRGYARYLCHLDNPDKAQYSPAAVLSLCGADYIDTINLVTDKYKAVREMIEFCAENNIYSYSDLLDYCITSNEIWFKVLCDSSSRVMRDYLQSKYWTHTTLRGDTDA